jgi:hypothetical protein
MNSATDRSSSARSKVERPKHVACASSASARPVAESTAMKIVLRANISW